MMKKAESGRRGQRHHEEREPVDALGDAAAAEEVEAHESGLEEKGEEALGGERSAEDIGHKLGVGGPVGAELEQHDNTARDADGEGHGEELAEKLPHPDVNLVMLSPAPPLNDAEHEAEPNGHRRENEMETHRYCELQTCQQDSVHQLPPPFGAF